jgi:hypothetical protein
VQYRDAVMKAKTYAMSLRDRNVQVMSQLRELKREKDAAVEAAEKVCVYGSAG